MLLLLPSELKSLIAELLVSSPKSLAALARTHSAYQCEAERALYDSIIIYAIKANSSKCVKSLTTNLEKAALVRSLMFKYVPYQINKKQRASTYLLKSLINMHSLYDLRVHSYRFHTEVEPRMIKGLGNILWLVCQSLIFSKPL